MYTLFLHCILNFYNNVLVVVFKIKLLLFTKRIFIFTTDYSDFILRQFNYLKIYLQLREFIKSSPNFLHECGRLKTKRKQTSHFTDIKMCVFFPKVCNKQTLEYRWYMISVFTYLYNRSLNIYVDYIRIYIYVYYQVCSTNNWSLNLNNQRLVTQNSYITNVHIRFVKFINNN